jgi:hypothetical protein
MSFTYTWKIESLKVKDEVNAEGVTLPRAVYQTYWKVTGTNSDGHSGEFSGATPFTAANVPSGSFTAFEDLTEATVIGWIQNVVNSDRGYKAHIDDQIQKRIDEAHGTAEQIESDALPWATPAEESSEDAGAVDPEEAEE